QEIEYADGKSEVFNANSPLRQELQALGYRYFIIGEQEKNNPVALTTAFISRYPLKSLPIIAFNVSHPAFDSFSEKDKKAAAHTTRDIQVVELDLWETPARIYNNHWRSQGCSDTRSCNFSERVRAANAQIVREAVVKDLKENPKLDVILLGDFNNDYFAKAMRQLGSMGNEKDIQDGIEGGYFYNLWYELPAGKRWEASHQGSYSTLGQILINSNLYDNFGLQYVDNSYHVVGQMDDASEILLNSDGTPLRWQELKLKAHQVDQHKSKALKNLIANRAQCQGPKPNKRRCYTSYTVFSGVGFSDHLPIVASFNILGDSFKNNLGQTSYSPSSTNDLTWAPPTDIEIEECPLSPDEWAKLPGFKDLNLSDPKWFKQCVYLNFGGNPIPLETTGIFNSNFINLGGQKLFLAMARGFDSRQIKEGKPVGRLSKKEMDQEGKAKLHPASNMCLQRKILQGEGGKLKWAVGRLGYYNGDWGLIISRRNMIELELPPNKANDCQQTPERFDR
ncbi:MAG: hypothetical protein WCG27_12005, partial [Pseudomonadota bacterium]